LSLVLKLSVFIEKGQNKLIILGINPKDAAKKFGKRFACGSSVVENNAVEIQGDVTYDLMEYIPKEFKEVRQYIFLKSFLIFFSHRLLKIISSLRSPRNNDFFVCFINLNTKRE